MKHKLLFLTILIATLQFHLHSQTQMGQDLDGESSFDESGRSISISNDGSIVAIGAWKNQGNGANSGHVRIYQFDGNDWMQLGQDIDGEAAEDFSGSTSINGDGTIVAIGAGSNDGNGDKSGHVRVYQFNGSSWVQMGQDIDGEAPGDLCGAVSINGNGSVVAIGAPKNDGNGTDAGHVRVYQFDGTNWIQLGQDIDGEAAGDLSGAGGGQGLSISSDGTIVAIGAYQNDGNGANSGHVRVYQYNGSSWIQLGQDIDGEAANDWSGFSCALNSSGSVLAIGAIQNSANGNLSGHVRVYEYSNNSWNQLGQDIDGVTQINSSGQAVSINDDGSILAISSPLSSGNGPQAGHVSIHEYNGNNWTQLGNYIIGEAAEDQSGYSVSLSKDGSVLAIGAHLNDGNGTNSGHVRVFDLSSLLGVDTFSDDLNISIYPNPTSDYINIKGYNEELFMTISDLSGRQIISRPILNRVEISWLESGMYIIRISDGEKSSIHKMIKN